MTKEVEESELEGEGITKAERLQEEQDEQEFQEEKIVDIGTLGLKVLNLPALKEVEKIFSGLRVEDPVGRTAPIKFVNIETLTIANWKRKYPKTKKNLHKDWCFDPKGSLKVTAYKGTRFAMVTITMITPFNYNGDDGIPDEDLVVDSSMFYLEQSESAKKAIADANKIKETYRVQQTKKHQDRVNADNLKEYL
ncbi:hypothetical protein MNB_SUP05-SYMBIONT-4-780 [hydrothermal vent metagenome]|uniref:Uncharacterized protein n=1 Tax=hydrothermal vent metagenome TaxID=652676 RepID=A0A1W1DZ30_9ZZZZ